MKHIHAELIHEWADGAEIEYFNHTNHEWEDVKNPSWNENTEYRIKPEPKPDIVHRTRIVIFEPYTDGVKFDYGSQNIQLTFDGETFNLKSAEVIK